MHRIPRFGTIGISIAGGAATLLFGVFILPFIPLQGMSPANAQSSAQIPNFYPYVDTGWVSMSNDYIPTTSGPAPVTFDRRYPYVPKG